jgi:hypothetical protein
MNDGKSKAKLQVLYEGTVETGASDHVYHVSLEPGLLIQIKIPGTAAPCFVQVISNSFRIRSDIQCSRRYYWSRRAGQRTQSI